MSYLWPEEMLSLYSFPFEIEIPEDVDPKELSKAVKGIVERHPFLAIQGDEMSGTISQLPETFFIPGISAFMYGTSVEYAIDKQSIKITIHKKQGPIIGFVEQFLLQEDKERISRIFLNAIKVVGNND